MWADKTIWWHVYPLGFVGAPIRGYEPTESPVARLRQLTNWLDYAVELGVSGLILGPIFRSSTHGYDSTDQFKIDPRLGTEQDFDDLVHECKARGLHIMLDGVFSHVGYDDPRVQVVLEEGPESADAPLFDIDWEHEDGPTPRVFEGHGALVRLNHADARAMEYSRNVMNFWLGRGISGWRLDAAYSVPAAFWAKLLPEVRSRFPHVWFLGEVIHGDYPAFITESTADSLTQYELWKAIWSSLRDGNFHELDWSLQRNNEFMETFIPTTFIGNHDVTRIASQLDQRGALTALAILMTIPGIPAIYYGDEQGFTGVKEENEAGDDAVRPPMPPTPADLLPFGQGMLRAHQDLIGLRRRNPWLTSSRVQTVEVDNRRYTYRAASTQGDDELLVRLDLDSPTPVTITDKSGAVLWQQQD